MTREQLHVNGSIFQLTDDDYYNYKICVSHSDRPVVTADRLMRSGDKSNEYVQLRITKHGVVFWCLIGGIFVKSRQYKFSEFKLISSPQNCEVENEGLEKIEQ